MCQQSRGSCSGPILLLLVVITGLQVAHGAATGGAAVLEKVQRPDADIPHMLSLGEEFNRAAHRRPPQCLKRPDRPPQAACRVFVLDLADLAAELGLPGCSVDDTVVDPLEGAVLPHPRVTGVRAGRPANGSGWVYPWQYEPHHQSHWAGPWYAKQTLKLGGNAALTLEGADTVFVYDYCYLMQGLADATAAGHWWLSSRYNATRTPGATLLQLYRVLLELPKWRRSGGRDFVFYHSHPGFAWGSEGETSEFLGTLCGALQWATMLVAENGQRWRCASFNPRSTLVVPYSFKDVAFGKKVAESADRPTLLFFRGKCYSAKAGNIGMVLRRSVVQGLSSLQQPDVDLCCQGLDAPPKVACTEANFAQNALRTQPRPQLLADMARSHFCLIMPGNSQSSGRLADAFFTGCIPVFLGPPFHTLPFAALIDYPSIGIFLNASVTPLPWWPKREGLTFEWALRPQGSLADRAHPKWWFPDVPRAVLQTITSMEDIALELRKHTEADVARKRQAMLAYRHLFTFNEHPTHPIAASDLVVELMCTYAKLGKRRRRQGASPHPPVPAGF